MKSHTVIRDAVGRASRDSDTTRRGIQIGFYR